MFTCIHAFYYCFTFDFRSIVNLLYFIFSIFLNFIVIWSIVGENDVFHQSDKIEMLTTDYL